MSMKMTVKVNETATMSLFACMKPDIFYGFGFKPVSKYVYNVVQMQVLFILWRS